MKQIIFFIIVIALILFWVWYFAFRIDKKKAIEIIKKHFTKADEKTLQNYGSDYLIAWAKALKIKKDTFEVDGKIYVTSTGKAK